MTQIGSDGGSGYRVGGQGPHGKSTQNETKVKNLYQTCTDCPSMTKPLPGQRLCAATSCLEFVLDPLLSFKLTHSNDFDQIRETPAILPA